MRHPGRFCITQSHDRLREWIFTVIVEVGVRFLEGIWAGTFPKRMEGGMRILSSPFSVAGSNPMQDQGTHMPSPLGGSLVGGCDDQFGGSQASPPQRAALAVR
ncbi:unnamed protein product [Eretmochelys imbricata]